jgi:hypothetical protein
VVKNCIFSIANSGFKYGNGLLFRQNIIVLSYKKLNALKFSKASSHLLIFQEFVWQTDKYFCILESPLELSHLVKIKKFEKLVHLRFF